MVYHQKLVAAVKVDGKVLRESGDSVSIPFGSEYSILLKNLNSVRIQAKVFIDGKDATEGTWLVIGPNASIDLERFIKNGNLQAGNRFKFIPRTKQIEQHRGLRADDGLIRIEYKTEKVDINVPRIHYYDHYVPIVHPCHPYPYWPRPWYWGDTYYLGVYNVGETVVGSGNLGTINTTECSMNANNVQQSVSFTKSEDAPSHVYRQGSSPTRSIPNKRAESPVRAMNMMSMSKCADPVDDSGITVPGSQSNQEFHTSAPFQVYDNSEVLVIRLRGEVAGKKVKKAVTVKTRVTCGTCGKVNKKGLVRFCSECGTALDLI